jgi:hypothetical protein
MSRRRQSASGFIGEMIVLALLVLALFAFLNSNLPTGIGKAVASGMHFGPTPSP